MRKTLKSRLQKCQVLSGQPRVSGDPSSRINQVATASLLSDLTGVAEPGLKAKKGQSDTIVAFAIGDRYPPCTVLLQDLQQMNLSDLCMDTHHRGYVLTVRRVADVVKLVTCSWTVVQEESSGETERLELSLHKSQHGQETLESGSIFKIKEPYFTLNDQGEPTLRINHPSDLVVYADSLPTDSSQHFKKEVGDTTGPTGTTAATALVTETARGYKEEGNSALKQQDLQLAHTQYTKGLQLVPKDGTEQELVCDLHRNRAYVNLLLKRYDEAMADALAAVTELDDQKYKELDSKAYLRAGLAAYSLGDFQQAKSSFEEVQRLATNTKDAVAHLRVTGLRLEEEATGVYDFKKMKARVLTSRPHVDAGSFTSNVKIGESPGRGRGLFATRNINAGELVLCEKAFCVVWGHQDEALTVITYDGRDDRIKVFPAGLCKAVMQKLRDNPSQIERVMGLYGDYKGIGNKSIIRDSNPVVDAFQVHDIIGRNAFGPGHVSSQGEDESNGSAGLWILASYVNHSCVANAKKDSVGDLMVLRATRPIRPGEEITHSYDESSDYDARTAVLMNTWGFTCTCGLCIAEKADDAALRKKRRELESEANALVERERNQAVKTKILAIVKGRRLARSITDTYDNERYKGLPRLALLRIEKWLAEAGTQ
jgi:tetratricopeptide (TPR) repeat protein